jgi:hypothetical protein
MSYSDICRYDANKDEVIVKIECDQIFENETNDGKFINDIEY